MARAKLVLVNIWRVDLGIYGAHYWVRPRKVFRTPHPLQNSAKLEYYTILHV